MEEKQSLGYFFSFFIFRSITILGRKRVEDETCEKICSLESVKINIVHLFRKYFVDDDQLFGLVNGQFVRMLERQVHRLFSICLCRHYVPEICHLRLVSSLVSKDN